MRSLKIQILVDNPKSWIIEYAEILAEQLKRDKHQVNIIHRHEDVLEGDILCLLGCERIFRNLSLNRNNLVVHESDLPQGKGWSPLTWQVLEGRNEIVVSLIEAAESVDSGVIYSQNTIKFNGTELVDELRFKQGNATIQLIMEFVHKFPNNEYRKQIGEESFYPKRTPENSELNVHHSIASQFNLLRICDNERYPAWFEFQDETYILKIFKREKNDGKGKGNYQ